MVGHLIVMVVPLTVHSVSQNWLRFDRFAISSPKAFTCATMDVLVGESILVPLVEVLISLVVRVPCSIFASVLLSICSSLVWQFDVAFPYVKVAIPLAH